MLAYKCCDDFVKVLHNYLEQKIIANAFDVDLAYVLTA